MREAPVINTVLAVPNVIVSFSNTVQTNRHDATSINEHIYRSGNKKDKMKLISYRSKHMIYRQK
jgi:hypothetical protein